MLDLGPDSVDGTPSCLMTGSDNPMPGSSGTLRRRLGDYLWVVREKYVDEELLRQLRQPARFFAASAEFLKPEQTGRTTVALVRSSHPGLREFVAKRYRSTSSWQLFKDSLRRSRALRSFELGLRLCEIEVPTAVPVAAGERRVAGCLLDSWLVTLYEPDTMPMHLFNARCRDLLRRQRVAQDLAMIFARLHDACLSHSDPSLANFLVKSAAPPGTSVVLIDLDGLRPTRSNGRKPAARDLRRLLRRGRFLRGERLRFLSAYCHFRKKRIAPRDLLPLMGPLPERVSYRPFAFDNAEPSDCPFESSSASASLVKE
jgi:tRNA A-37 threonylcarbamoyl transferase component Bud32